MPEHVILVDPSDTPVGAAEKLAAHRAGVLHRAFSVVVFDERGRMLLQQRALGKYHSGGLWSNACCGHPRPGEPTAAAAARRLHEEMGFSCPLQPSHWLRYRAVLANGLIENEYDHIFLGRGDARPQHDPAEVSAWRWVGPAALRDEIESYPERFTCWFRLAFDDVLTQAELLLGASAGYPLAVPQRHSRAS